MSLHRNEDGTLPAIAWPGGYSIVYYCADGECLCAKCANGENGSKASETLDPECPWNDQWRLIGADVYWEGPEQTCAHCDAPMPSEYGDPDEGKDSE